jgi:hypothetical protein
MYNVVAVVVEATRDVATNQELYCDYGSGVWMHEFFMNSID